MPELPEVEHVCSYLRRRLSGATFAGPPRQLKGARVRAVERVAKLVLVRLEGARTLVFHLKMTGQLWVRERGAPPDRWTRAVFRLEDGCELRFDDQRKFGWWRIYEDAALKPMLNGYGPDALRATERQIAGTLTFFGRRRRVKTLLLDQFILAGVGNIYADEICHAARIHPATRIEDLSPAQIKKLARATKAVMAAAVRRRDHDLEPDQRRVGSGDRTAAARLGPQVYQRTGEPCRQCKTPIERIMLGGRSTHLCPKCQPTTGRAPASARGASRSTRSPRASSAPGRATRSRGRRSAR